MNTEQREEIEKGIFLLDLVVFTDDESHDAASKALAFAHHQLNLRLDGEKLRDGLWSKFGVILDPYVIASIKAIALECLTTTPEEKK